MPRQQARGNPGYHPVQQSKPPSNDQFDIKTPDHRFHFVRNLDGTFLLRRTIVEPRSLELLG